MDLSHSIEYITITDILPLFFDFDLDNKTLKFNDKDFILIGNDRHFTPSGITEYRHTFQDLMLWEQDKHNMNESKK